MSSVTRPDIDPREPGDIANDLFALRPGYVPEWLPTGQGSDAALVQVFARMVQGIIHRQNQAPDKHKLAFLETFGIELTRAQAARAPITLKLEAGAPDSSAPAGTRLVAPPPPESTTQIFFETERAVGIASATLQQVVSLWPGRDQYIDHSADLTAGVPIHLFRKRDLVDTPHALYLAHDVLLALAGNSELGVGFELALPGSESLSIVWEYWDGKVWREFQSMRPECGEEAANLDGTRGLTRSGRVLLKTECAETAKINVNGIESFWVRGRLDITLPPDPARVLPDVDTITLSTIITRPLAFSWAHRFVPPPAGSAIALASTGHVFTVLVLDDSGAPLQGIILRHPSKTGPIFTDLDGRVKLPPGSASSSLGVEIGHVHTPFDIPFPLPGNPLELKLTVDGVAPDQAFADATSLDLTKPFFPFGLQPQPGSAFYLNSAEAFSKPKAKLQIYVQNAQSPQDHLSAANANNTTTRLSHVISWEYWNGKAWTAIRSHANNPSTNPPEADASPEDFTGTGVIEFPLPEDMVARKVNDQDGLWIRARLASGGYGIAQTVTLPTGDTFTYVLPKPPAVAKLVLGYTWQNGPYRPQSVLTHNDFAYADVTEANRVPGETFRPYTTILDSTPTLYLGFDKPLPVDRIGIFFDVEEQRGDTTGPALVWEYWDGFAWEEIRVDDESRNLRVPGIAALIGPDDSAPKARFGAPLHWLRARLKEDGPPGEPAIDGIFPNTVWASQLQTVTDDALGVGSGQPNQVLAFRQIPILPGEQIEVRELVDARANVEWRIVASSLFKNAQETIRQIEELLVQQTEIVMPPLRLIRDRNVRVTEAWVTWESRPNFFESGPLDRHYVLEHARGRLSFGDGVEGRIPPQGAAISARRYQTGGGLRGNVAARAISQVVGAVPGLESAFNPKPAEGGADIESLSAAARRGPRTLRLLDRALSAEDYETLALESSPAVAFVRTIPARDPDGRTTPGWATVIIIPESDEPRPYPSFGLREEVQAYIEARAPACLAGAARIIVTGPDYLPVDVDATLAPVDPNNAGEVENAARSALEAFLHPLHGGPDKEGWALGRDVYISDVAAVLESVPGVDFVTDLALLQDGVPSGTVVIIGPDRTVVAGTIRLKLVEGEGP